MADDDEAVQSSPELLFLHAVRLTGVANESDVTARADLSPSAVHHLSHRCLKADLIAEFEFADVGGWTLTAAGSGRVDTLLASELASKRTRPVLEQALDAFELLNPRVVQLVTAWQLASGRGGQATDGLREEHDSPHLLSELDLISLQLASMSHQLTARLARFRRYPHQFSAALERVEVGEQQWLAGPRILSAHTVWAELHQDLLSSLQRRRTP